eukprot:1883800-Amphidinium_carterae.1
MIRFHSFYPWHDKGAYAEFETAEDAEMKQWVKDLTFQQVPNRPPATKQQHLYHLYLFSMVMTSDMH